MVHYCSRSSGTTSIGGSVVAGENVSSAAIFGCGGTFSLATTLPQIRGGLLELSA